MGTENDPWRELHDEEWHRRNRRQGALIALMAATTIAIWAAIFLLLWKL